MDAQEHVETPRSIVMDAQEHVETPRSIIRERKPPKKCPYFRALICSIIDSKTSTVQGATDQQSWRDSIVQDNVCDIVLRSEGEPVPSGSSKSTFFAKREC